MNINKDEENYINSKFKNYLSYNIMEIFNQEEAHNSQEVTTTPVNENYILNKDKALEYISKN